MNISPRPHERAALALGAVFTIAAILTALGARLVGAL